MFVSLRTGLCAFAFVAGLGTNGANAQTAASWTNSSGGVLGSGTFSVTGGGGASIQSSFAGTFATNAEYSIPLTVSNYYDYSVSNNSTTFSFTPSQTVYLYALYWRQGTYTFNLAPVIISGFTGASLSGTTLTTTAGFSFGILAFRNLSTLAFSSPESGGNQALTLATAPPPPGPYADNTSVAMEANAQTLRFSLDRRLSSLALATSYDCQTFDKQGVCLSFQARYSNFDSMHEGAGVFTAAYRVTPQIRVGAFIDYRVSEKEPTGIKFSNDLPTFGGFAGYSQNPDGTGLQGKVLGAYQKGKATITRSGEEALNTEAGSGRANLNSFMVSGELGWGFAVSSSMLATPYVSVRYTDVTRGAYTEATSDTVEFPISYNSFYQRLTTATAGVRVSGMLTDRLGYQIGAGIEQDLNRKTSRYSGTSTIPDLENFSLATTGANNRTRGVGTVGMFYQVEKNQRLIGNVSIRNQAYTSQTAVTAMAGYQVAF